MCGCSLARLQSRRVQIAAGGKKHSARHRQRSPAATPLSKGTARTSRSAGLGGRHRSGGPVASLADAQELEAMHVQSASPPKIAHNTLAGRGSPPLHPEGVLPRSGVPDTDARAVVSVRHRAKAACLKVHQTGLQIGFQLIRNALRSLPSSGALDRVRCIAIGGGTRVECPCSPAQALCVRLLLKLAQRCFAGSRARQPGRLPRFRSLEGDRDPPRTGWCSRGGATCGEALETEGVHARVCPGGTRQARQAGSARHLE